MTVQPLDRHALGRRLSVLANAEAGNLWHHAEQKTHRARRVGITGAPGAGKSTLVGQLALLRAERGRLGVLAIDPSSPNSGGAILGDRIRMDELDVSDDVYIRSLGSRGTSDGLADNLPEILDAMDDFDFDEVILETVGVGQAEYAAKLQVDTLVLVLLPESGDMIQAMKAGIAEMADIFVVNKADLPGASRTVNDIRRIASIQRTTPGGWNPPVLMTTNSKPESIAELSATIDRHQAWAAPATAIRELERSRYKLTRLIERRTARFLACQKSDFSDAPLDVQISQVAAAVGGGTLRKVAASDE